MGEDAWEDASVVLEGGGGATTGGATTDGATTPAPAGVLLVNGAPGVDTVDGDPGTSFPPDINCCSCGLIIRCWIRRLSITIVEGDVVGVPIGE